MERKNALPLEDEELEIATGGAINVYDAPSVNNTYWKYTCRTCGDVGIVALSGNETVKNCATCHSTNIDAEIYKY